MEFLQRYTRIPPTRVRLGLRVRSGEYGRRWLHSDGEAARHAVELAGRNGCAEGEGRAAARRHHARDRTAPLDRPRIARGGSGSGGRAPDAGAGLAQYSTSRSGEDNRQLGPFSARRGGHARRIRGKPPDDRRRRDRDGRERGGRVPGPPVPARSYG